MVSNGTENASKKFNSGKKDTINEEALHMPLEISENNLQNIIHCW